MALLQKSSFVSASPVVARRTNAVRPAARVVAPKALFGGLFGGKSAESGSGAAAPQYFVCIDCGYIYDGAKEFKSLPSSYKCPACNSPKSRFKSYKGTDVKGKPNNSGASMRKRLGEKKW